MTRIVVVLEKQCSVIATTSIQGIGCNPQNIYTATTTKLILCGASNGHRMYEKNHWATISPTAEAARTPNKVPATYMYHAGTV